MVLSIILCVCIIFIFTGLLFFMETEGGWNFKSVFSNDEKDEKIYRRDVQVEGSKSCTAVITVEKSDVKRETVYQNMMDCRILTTMYDLHESGVPVQCCGYGSCINVCPQSAISISKNQAVIGENCNGCGLCVEACPLHLISMKECENPQEKKGSIWFKFWHFWFTILKREDSDGSIALWE